jgi:hypothetical protein
MDRSKSHSCRKGRKTLRIPQLRREPWDVACEEWRGRANVSGTFTATVSDR